MTTRLMLGQTSWAMVWSRALPAGDVAYLTYEPYAMFRPSPSPAIRYWWGGGTTDHPVSLADSLVGSWCRASSRPPWRG